MTAADSDAARMRRVLETFAPYDERAAAAQARMLAFLDEHGATALSRTCVPGHFTASCLLLDAAGARALLTHHVKLDRWLQLGGHCDGDADLVAVARREAIEESGLPDVTIDPRPVDVDIHEIPPHGNDPAHLHLDTRFLAHAPAGAHPRAGDESHELRWFAPSDLDAIDADPSLRRLFARAFP